MSSLKPFEGPDAEELVARVRRELGPHARIVKGETVRTGGVLGFFAKERYRLLAEVPRSGAAPPVGRDPVAADPARSPRGAGAERPADVFTRLAEGTADRNDVATTPPAPPPAEAGTAAAAVPRPPAGTGPAPASPPALASPEATAAAVGALPDVPFGEVLSQVASALADDAPAPAAAAGTSPARAARRRPRRPEQGLATRLCAAGLNRASASATAALVADGEDLSVALTRIFARLPAPPPLAAGPACPLVVVGPADQAQLLAADLADGQGADPAAVGVAALAAADRRHPAVAGLATGRGAADAIDRWRHGPAPIVAIDAPLGPRQRAWARHVLTALRPATVVGVVDATRKSSDVAAWAKGLGGLDALVLDGVESTASPAQVLRTGIPVARLDGHPASAARWAASVMDVVAPCG